MTLNIVTHHVRKKWNHSDDELLSDWGLVVPAKMWAHVYSWDFDNGQKLYAASKGNLQRLAFESYDQCKNKSECALVGGVQTLALDPAED